MPITQHDDDEPYMSSLTRLALSEGIRVFVRAADADRARLLVASSEE